MTADEFNSDSSEYVDPYAKDRFFWMPIAITLVAIFGLCSILFSIYWVQAGREAATEANTHRSKCTQNWADDFSNGNVKARAANAKWREAIVAGTDLKTANETLKRELAKNPVPQIAEYCGDATIDAESAGVAPKAHR